MPQVLDDGGAPGGGGFLVRSVGGEVPGRPPQLPGLGEVEEAHSHLGLEAGRGHTPNLGQRDRDPDNDNEDQHRHDPEPRIEDEKPDQLALIVGQGFQIAFGGERVHLTLWRR